MRVPSLHFRKGIALVQLFKMFSDDQIAKTWVSLHTPPNER